jgi:hypothetical protein
MEMSSQTSRCMARERGSRWRSRVGASLFNRNVSREVRPAGVCHHYLLRVSAQAMHLEAEHDEHHADGDREAGDNPAAHAPIDRCRDSSPRPPGSKCAPAVGRRPGGPRSASSRSYLHSGGTPAGVRGYLRMNSFMRVQPITMVFPPAQPPRSLPKRIKVLTSCLLPGLDVEREARLHGCCGCCRSPYSRALWRRGPRHGSASYESF